MKFKRKHLSRRRYKTKVCTHCKRRRPMGTFYAHPNARDGKTSWCKFCLTKHNADSAKRLTSVERRRKMLKKCWGLTLEGFEALSRAQSNKCGICGQDAAKLQIDHDHITGKIRGLLCGTCNRALGLMHDSIVKLQYAITYLERFQRLQ